MGVGVFSSELEEDIMSKKVIVIGGGIAGLSAGIYARKSGFDVTILESHSRAGGNCTSWERGGYLFEGGMHWLSGSGKDEDLHKSWRYVGALDDSVGIQTAEPFFEYNHMGVPVRAYRNVDAMEKHLIELSPRDEKEIRGLCSNVRKVQNLAMPVTDILGVKATKKRRMPVSLLFSAMPAFFLMRKFSKIPRDAYIKRFNHEGIRNMLRSCTEDKTGIVPFFFTMGILARGDGGFPEGGSLPFVERIVRTFRSLGGELLLGTRADRVVIEDGKATGVVAGERILDADAVIVTTDTMAVGNLFDALPEADWLGEMRGVCEPSMVTFVSLGINADLKNYPQVLTFKIKRPISIGTQTYEYLSVNNYAADPAYSAEGKTAVTVMLSGDTYDFWIKAREENRYGEEKQKLADEVERELAEQMPEIAGKIEVSDVATPLTYERYCGTWKGSFMTEMTPSMKMKTYPAVVKGLSGVYFAGHRLMPPGGLPAALMTGRAAVQYLCRDTGEVFVSEN